MIEIDRQILIYIGIGAAIPIFFILIKWFIRLNEWRTSQEVHLSGWESVKMRAKYLILGTILGAIGTYLGIQIGKIL